MFNSLTDTVADAAGIIADFLHFSEPEKGPLADFNESGSDMMKNFIKSMESEQADLQDALNETAGIISQGFDNSYEISANSMVHHTSDFDAGFASFQQTLSALPGGDNSTWVFPIYLGTEHIDTIVVDALDRANFISGGH